ncbi:MAG: hypothetical protein RIQ94_193 [Pseudomonadota bacterium]|jgi:hypothetical protein
MQSIKTNFQLPIGGDPAKQAARMAQDLSANFKAVDEALKASGVNLSLASLVPIGTLIYSKLTLAQVQAANGKSWVSADGAGCIGSAYYKLTGLLSVPNNATTTITPSGTSLNVFIKIN